MNHALGSGQVFGIECGRVTETQGIVGEVERLYHEAVSKPKTDAQAKRLEMFGDNMVMAHHNMWKSKLMPDAEARRRLDFGNSLYVYDADTLARSAALVLENRRWMLPAACRTLVAALYEHRPERDHRAYPGRAQQRRCAHHSVL